MRLFRLELKRVVKTRTTWMLLAAALLISVLMAWLPVTFETRNVVEDGVEKELTGFDAIRVKRQAQAGIAGNHGSTAEGRGGDCCPGIEGI